MLKGAALWARVTAPPSGRTPHAVGAVKGVAQGRCPLGKSDGAAVRTYSSRPVAVHRPLGDSQGAGGRTPHRLRRHQIRAVPWWCGRPRWRDALGCGRIKRKLRPRGGESPTWWLHGCFHSGPSRSRGRSPEPACRAGRECLPCPGWSCVTRAMRSGPSAHRTGLGPRGGRRGCAASTRSAAPGWQRT